MWAEYVRQYVTDFPGNFTPAAVESIQIFLILNKALITSLV